MHRARALYVAQSVRNIRRNIQKKLKGEKACKGAEKICDTVKRSTSNSTRLVIFKGPDLGGNALYWWMASAHKSWSWLFALSAGTLGFNCLLVLVLGR